MWLEGKIAPRGFVLECEGRWSPHGCQRMSKAIRLGNAVSMLTSEPNQGLELTGNSVRSFVAPAIPRSSGPAFGPRVTGVERRYASDSGH